MARLASDIARRLVYVASDRQSNGRECIEWAGQNIDSEMVCGYPSLYRHEQSIFARHHPSKPMPYIGDRLW